MERVTLNVGGQLFTTTLATLRSFGTETMLGALSLKEGIENQDDPVFLDRDPKLFEHVLNCMRHRRVFEAKQLDLSPSIWELELAYYGLPTTTEKKESKKRPIDVVTQREDGQKKLMDSQREKIEAVLMWMLSFYPDVTKATFADFDRTAVKKPDNMAQEVFETDAAYVKGVEKAWRKICNENKLHVYFTYGSDLIQNITIPAISNQLNIPGKCSYVTVGIKCFGD